MKIYKYELDYSDRQIISAKIIKPLSVQIQNRKVCLWAIVDETASNHKTAIKMYGTGSEINADEQLTFISTLQIGEFSFHYFIEDNA